MKILFSVLLLTFAGASTTAATPVKIGTRAGAFHPVSLPGDSYIPGPALLPGRLIAGYNADDSAYNADSWAQHVLQQCEGFSECTGTASWSAINSGSSGGRGWFGYVFRGGSVSAADFRSAGGDIHGARAYSAS